MVSSLSLGYMILSDLRHHFNFFFALHGNYGSAPKIFCILAPDLGWMSHPTLGHAIGWERESPIHLWLLMLPFVCQSSHAPDLWQVESLSLPKRRRKMKLTLPSGDTKSRDNGKSKPFAGRAADNWNNNIIYHNGKQYLILRGLMACMLIQKQSLDWWHLYFGVCFEKVMLQKSAYIWKTGSHFYTGLINLLWVRELYPRFGNFPLIVS